MYNPENFGSYSLYEHIVTFYSNILANKLSQNNVWAVGGTF
jgi:hypothetical protein